MHACLCTNGIGWQVWKACVELRESGNWAVAGIPRPTWVQFEAQLAEGTPHELAPLTIPVKPPGAPADLPTAVVCLTSCF